MRIASEYLELHFGESFCNIQKHPAHRRQVRRTVDTLAASLTLVKRTLDKWRYVSGDNDAIRVRGCRE